MVELVLPNPNHPVFGGPSRDWISSGRADAFPDLVGSASLVAIAIIGLAMWRSRRSVPGVWIVFTLAFGLLALGPFVHIARIDTHIPGPWALLRYVPVIGLARSPSRFAIVATLGLSVCLGFALATLRREWPSRRRAIAAGAAFALSLELAPTPRPLFEAATPAVYTLIAADPDESKRVLELPTGIRDGTSSLGDLSPSAQFFQITHRKPLLGGYLSRVTEQRKRMELDRPAMAVLYTLSEGRPVSARLVAEALATRAEFLAAACVGYVVVDQKRASKELQSFATALFELIPVSEEHGRQLFIPGPAAIRSCGNAARRTG